MTKFRVTAKKHTALLYKKNGQVIIEHITHFQNNIAGFTRVMEIIRKLRIEKGLNND